MIQQSHFRAHIQWKSNLKRYMHPYAHSSTIYNGQDMETTEMSFNRWRDEEDVVHTHNEPLLSHRKGWHNSSCSNMEATKRLSHYVKQVRKRKTNVIRYYSYVESKPWHKSADPWNRHRLTDIEDRSAVAKGRGEGEGWRGSLGLADARYYNIKNESTTRPHCMVQGTTFSTLWSVIMEKNKKKNVQTHMIESLYCCTVVINTTL